MHHNTIFDYYAHVGRALRQMWDEEDWWAEHLRSLGYVVIRPKEET